VPTIRWIGPYRFFFFAQDEAEPPHVHVERDRHRAKFWLVPVRLVWSRRFSQPEIRRIQRLVEREARVFLERWNAYFSP